MPGSRLPAPFHAALAVRLAKHASLDPSWQRQLARHAVDGAFRGSFDWRF